MKNKIQDIVTSTWRKEDTPGRSTEGGTGVLLGSGSQISAVLLFFSLCFDLCYTNSFKVPNMPLTRKNIFKSN